MKIGHHKVERGEGEADTLTSLNSYQKKIASLVVVYSYILVFVGDSFNAVDLTIIKSQSVCYTLS